MVIYNQIFFGAIAQLGERLRGTQEVGGSIPPSSTNSFKNCLRNYDLFGCAAARQHVHI